MQDQMLKNMKKHILVKQPDCSESSDNRGGLVLGATTEYAETGVAEDVMMTLMGISGAEASYLKQSAKPGEPGNIIIYGHNTRQIMGNIRALKGYETIQLTTQDGTIHKYKISLIDEVDPSETKYLLPTEEETVTLYTCSGFMDKKRFIVQAKPISSEN